MKDSLLILSSPSTIQLDHNTINGCFYQLQFVDCVHCKKYCFICTYSLLDIQLLDFISLTVNLVFDHISVRCSWYKVFLGYFSFFLSIFFSLLSYLLSVTVFLTVNLIKFRACNCNIQIFKRKTWWSLNEYSLAWQFVRIDNFPDY